MKAILSILSLSLLLTACAPSTPSQTDVDVNGDQNQTNVYEDQILSFSYPLDWETRQTDEMTLFSSQFEYFDGNADSSAEDEKEGSIIYLIDDKPADMTLVEYLTSNFEECSSATEESDDEFAGWGCFDPKVESWTEGSLDGYTTYSTDWLGIPESGEIGKSFYIDLGDQFAKILAVKTGQTDEDTIEQAFEDAVSSVEIK